MGDDYDDRDDLFGETPAPAFPGSVMAAAVVWIGIGCLELLAIASLGVVAVFNKAAILVLIRFLGPCSMYLGSVGIVFLLCGQQTLTGKASDVLGRGVLSVALGVFTIVIAAAVIVIAGGNMLGNNNQIPEKVAYAVAWACGVIGGLLIASGTFALIGRTRYLEWREYQREVARQRGRRSDHDDFHDNF